MDFNNKNNFVLLVVLDGWGIAPNGPGNAVAQANTINMNRFWQSYPHTVLKASGEAVGLPRGEAGNTETGHLNLGAGRIVYQDLERINMAIADGTFYENKELIEAIEHAKKNNSKLHYMGLIGAGGVHSNINHLFALIDLAKKHDFKNLFIHLFTDGRDSPPTSALTYVKNLENVLARVGVGKIASIMGRYWAMDRDHRWDRTEKAYRALTKGEGKLVKSAEEAIEASYALGKTDEFIEPSILIDGGKIPIALIGNNDSVVFFNFRIDRPRQLARAFMIEDFSKANYDFSFDPYMVKYEKKHELNDNTKQIPGEPFPRGERLTNLCFVMMTKYDDLLSKAGARIAFPPEIVTMPLGRVIAETGKRQLRMAESEKERFVTFYFNGQQDIVFPEEVRLIIPSPKVATYDLKPEMSARDVTDTVIKELEEENEYSFVLVNFANADMVGHTGNIGATVTACQVVDECVGKLSNFVLAHGGTMLITADHGNAEEKINLHTGEAATEHTSNPVPFIAVSKEFTGNSSTLPEGILADVAPTVLHLMGINIPTSMTGRNLLEEALLRK
ncbi:MAG TPA: 2,3-bisphosphoglycerate-independent phosphoglycerate mutase [Patescibacteria group bacterium]